MKNYTVRLVYTAYVEYDVTAEDEDQANDKAWKNFELNPPEPTYGNWETCDISEAESCKTTPLNS